MSNEATLARHAQTDRGAGDLLGRALASENMARAWKRVKASKGSAGIDGRTVPETGEYLKTAWPGISTLPIADPHDRRMTGARRLWLWRLRSCPQVSGNFPLGPVAQPAGSNVGRWPRL